MPQIEQYSELQQKTQVRAEILLRESIHANTLRTDRLFVGLLVFQWVAGIVVACTLSPQLWAGTTSQTHPHVRLAILMGAGIIAYPLLLIIFRPGSPLTCHVVAVAQMLTSALLIHLTGGRIETHFHIFGSLAFLAFYRDWRVLITASAVTAADHFLRGLFLPLSIYGSQVPGIWRWLEHAGYVVFEDIFLIISIVQSRREMQSIAARQAQMESTNEIVEAKVIERTTELRTSEASLRAGEQLTRLIVDTALDAVVTINAEGRVLKWNPQAEAIFGWTQDEALNRRLTELMIPEPYREAHLQELEEYARSRTGMLLNQRVERTALRRNGEEFPIELAVSPLQIGDSYIFSAFVRDITQRRMLETQLAHAQKMESVGQLAAGIAHEINTPIQYIGDNIRFLQESFRELHAVQNQCLQLLTNAPQDTTAAQLVAQTQAAQDAADTAYLFEEIPKAVAQSLDGVERVSQIVMAMKHFSHPGSEDKTLVDLNRAIDSTLTVARNEWKYFAEMVTDFDTTLPLVSCLPGDFNQVVLNLIVNAGHAIADVVKDTGEKGTITVSTRNLGQWVEVRIQDTGTGIPEPARARIFDPFFTTKEVGKGTGQGLSIAHSIIVEKHEGTIGFETEMGQGTTFVLRLPLEAENLAWQDAA